MKPGWLFAPALLFALCDSLSAAPLARNGVLDLRGHNFHREGSVFLQGEFWAQDRTSGQPGPTHLVSVPGAWSDQKTARFPARGVLEYRLTVLLPDGIENPGLLTPQASSAAEYRVNGRLIATVGVIGRDLESEVMWRGRQVVSLPAPDNGRLNLSIRISNYHDERGGIFHLPMLGDYRELTREYRRDTIVSAFLIGVLFMIAAYHGLVFLLTGRKTVGGLALFTGIIATRMLFTTPVAIGAFVDLTGNWPLATEVGAFFLAIPAFSLYFRALFPGVIPRRLNLAIVLASSLAILSLPFGSSVYLRALVFFQFFALAFIAVILFCWLRAAFRGARSTFGFGLGLLALLLGSVVDIVNAMVDGAASTYIAPAIVTFALIQTVVLAQRSAADFTERGRLTRSLEQATGDLAELNELSRQANANIDVHEILSTMQQYTARHFGLEMAWLLLVTSDRKELRGLALAGDFDADQAEFAYQFRTPLDHSSGALYHVVRRKRPAGLRAVSGHRVRHQAEANFVRVFRAESVVLLPLIFAESCIGVLILISSEVRDSAGKNQLPRLMNAANLVVSAVRNATLLDEAVRQRNRAHAAVAESEKLGEFMRDVHSSVELKATLDKISEYIHEHFGMDQICFLRVFPDEEMIRTLHIYDRSGMLAASAHDQIRYFAQPLRPELGTFFRTYSRKRTLYIDKFLRPAELNAVDRSFLGAWSLSAVIQIPLIVQNEVIGIANLSSSHALSRRLTAEQLASLKRFCGQVASAIHTASLVEMLEEQRKESIAARREADELNAFSLIANEALTLEEVMLSLARNLELRFGTTGLWFLSLDWQTRTLHTDFSQSPEGVWSEEQRDFVDGFHARIGPELGTLYRTIQRRRPLYISELPPLDSMRHELDRSIAATLGIAALVHLPVQVRNEVIGIVCLAWNGTPDRRLTRRELQAMERLGNQAAGAIYNLRVLKEVEAARADSERLLLSILPETIAAEIKAKGQATPRQYESVTVLFTDFVGFTKLSEGLSPDRLLTELDAAFTFFDEVARRHNLEKLKTIGDAYMCAGGIPTPNWTHPIDACLAALEFQRFIEQMKEVKRFQGAAGWDLRVGINTGPVVAGVVGVHKFAYDIWGDAVNTASRVESAGAAGRVNVSENTYRLTADFFDYEERGAIEVKGKGLVPMYFLNGLKREYARDVECCVPNERFFEEYNDRQTAGVI